MMRSILLFTSAAFLGYLSLSSYKNGAANAANIDRTGGPLSGGQTCGAVGCHSGGAGTVTGQIFVKDQTSGDTVTQYLPGTIYQVVVSGSGGSFSKFGFQVVALTSSNQKAGSVKTVVAPVRKSNIGLIEYVEHNTLIDPSGGLYTASYIWEAPPSGAGQISFYGIINAVNNNNSTSGDKPSAPFSTVLSEAPTSVSELSPNIRIAAYPNPTASNLRLKFEDAPRGRYTVSIFDVAGRKMYYEELEVVSGSEHVNIPSSGWVSGVYYTQVMKEGAQRMIPIIKQ